jgi:uncharacterized membrane protein YhaH (DUF805 family)
MNMADAVASAFKNYSNFEGRASRSEYWYWTLYSVLVSFAIGLFKGFNEENLDIYTAFNVIGILINLIFFLPSLSVTARRFHDIDKSGWNYLWAFTIIGIIPYLIWMTRPGSIRPNKWGLPPLSPNTTEVNHEDAGNSYESVGSNQGKEYRLFGFDEEGYVIKIIMKTTDVELTPPGIIVGRDTNCKIVISNKSLSRQHAQFYSSENSLWIRDLNSTNGTRINGLDVELASAKRIKDGDTLLLGMVELSVTEI